MTGVEFNCKAATQGASTPNCAQHYIDRRVECQRERMFMFNGHKHMYHGVDCTYQKLYVGLPILQYFPILQKLQ